MKTLGGWILFALMQCVLAAFFLVGTVLLIPFAALRAWRPRPSKIYTDRTVLAWRGGWLLYPWDNEEDGVTGNASYRAHYADSGLSAYRWSAWRNSANNLRFLFAWKDGPFKRVEYRGWYAQAGFRPDTGWPVLSAGKIN